MKKKTERYILVPETVPSGAELIEVDSVHEFMQLNEKAAQLSEIYNCDILIAAVTKKFIKGGGFSH